MAATSEAPSTQLAPAIFLDWQPGFQHLPAIALFNLTEDIPGHPKGSTISARTLSAAGYALPVYPDNKAA